MNLGQLIDMARSMDPKEDLRIYSPTCLLPGRLHSYRGYYEDLAISPLTDGGAATIGDFLKLLDDAVGRTFEGYKGGDFTMGRDTRVWLSEYGTNSGALVTGLQSVRYATWLTYTIQD